MMARVKKDVSIEELKEHFVRARAFVRSLNLNRNEWRLWSRGYMESKGMRPDFVPSNPDARFRMAGWVSWSDWLSEARYLPFLQAREQVRALGLKTFGQWQDYCKDGQKPVNIPRSPDKAYKEEFIGFKDWIGVPEFLSFEEAREYVQSLKLGGQVGWRKYSKLGGGMPLFIPRRPEVAYKDKWQGFGDWTGSGRIRQFNGKSLWMPFEEAREFVRSLNLKDHSAWKIYSGGGFCDKPKIPSNIPKMPHFVYKTEFKGLADWIGNGKAKTKRDGAKFDYKQSIEFVHGLKLISAKEWKAYTSGKMVNLPELPPFVPKNPIRSFSVEWAGWEEWLGCKLARGKYKAKFLPFEEARLFAQTLLLTSRSSWENWCKNNSRPEGIPYSPNRAFAEQWKGWGDWLGSAYVIDLSRKDFLPFEQAREFARSLGLKDSKEWWAWSKVNRPENIPSTPAKHYKEQWKGMSDFLGNENVKPILLYKEVAGKIQRLKRQAMFLNEDELLMVDEILDKMLNGF